jgi:hypothetical protein
MASGPSGQSCLPAMPSDDHEVDLKIEAAAAAEQQQQQQYPRSSAAIAAALERLRPWKDGTPEGGASVTCAGELSPPHRHRRASQCPHRPCRAGGLRARPQPPCKHSAVRMSDEHTVRPRPTGLAPLAVEGTSPTSHGATVSVGSAMPSPRARRGADGAVALPLTPGNLASPRSRGGVTLGAAEGSDHTYANARIRLGEGYQATSIPELMEPPTAGALARFEHPCLSSLAFPHLIPFCVCCGAHEWSRVRASTF